MGAGWIATVGESIVGFLEGLDLRRAASVLAVLLAGYLAVRLLLLAAKRLGRSRLSPRAGSVVEKAVRYGGAAIVIVNASEVAGIDLSAVLGAAGIAGIALGFAAQTSMSNVISGLFLFSEKTFEVGDVVQVDAVSGVVESVDMLSVKIRTFDNKLVRVPNETMIKSNIVNVTRWPERRLDLGLVLPYGSDLEIVEVLLRDAAMSVPSALAEPEPFFLVGDMGPNGLSVTFGVWFKKDDFAALKNALVPAILRKLEAEGIRPAAGTVVVAPLQAPHAKAAAGEAPKAKRRTARP